MSIKQYYRECKDCLRRIKIIGQSQVTTSGGMSSYIFSDGYKLIESMRALGRMRSSLLNNIAFNNSILRRSPQKRELVQKDQPLEIRGLTNLYMRIMKFKEVEFIPIYLQYYRRFSYPGINLKVNYSLYQQYINLLIKKMARKQPEPDKIKEEEEPAVSEQVMKSKEESQKQAKRAMLVALISIVLLLLLEPKAKKHGKGIGPTGQLQGSESSIDDQAVIAKLFEGLKTIRIRQTLPQKNNEYKVTFQYEDNSSETFRYNGNINNLLAMVESKEKGKFERTKIYHEHEQYSYWDAFTDSFKLITPFIAIVITVYIFKRLTPDSLISKLSPKKSYKIEGIRDIKIKFDDVAGMQQAKKEITEFVDFLKHGEKYRQIGARIPKGALLTGPPGTGKTMLAKATAGQSGVTFFYISGSEFVEIFVGMGASKVRQLFNRARMEAPSIIFIDEIDAIGKKRESSRNQQKDSTLNQLLVEMDGFGSHETVIVLAATNRKDILDNALTRPGRFDRMVQVTLPEIKAREEIFLVHLKPLKVDPNKKLSDVAKRLAQLTPGFSGADIANLCNEAAIIAIRKGKTYVEDKDFEDASQRITAGYEKKGLANPQTKKRVAYHEAGHAICGWFLKGGDPLVKLTIIPRSKGALGYAQYLPKSSYIITKSDLIDKIAIMLGGLTSQEMHFQQISSGASDDLQKVYQMSRRMVAQFGMGRRTYNVTLDEESYVRKESQALSSQMDHQISQLVQEAQKRCRQILQRNKQAVGRLAEMLLQKETINSEDIKSVLGERPSFK